MHVHQARIHADGAISGGVGVHLLAQIHLEVEIETVFIDVLARQAGQALGVLVVGGGQLLRAVAVGTVLQGHGLEFFVRHGDGLEHVQGSAHLVSRLAGARATRAGGAQGRRDGRQAAGPAAVGGGAARQDQCAGHGDVRQLFHGVISLFGWMWIQCSAPLPHRWRRVAPGSVGNPGRDLFQLRRNCFTHARQTPCPALSIATVRLFAEATETRRTL